jgi:hypothetical protein
MRIRTAVVNTAVESDRSLWYRSRAGQGNGARDRRRIILTEPSWFSPHGIQHQIENQEHLILAAAFPFAYNSRFSADEYSGLDLLHSSSEFSLKGRFFQSELTQDEAAPDGIHVDISEVGYFGVW